MALIRATALKLGVFGTTMVLVFAGLVIVFGQFRGGSSGDYSAIFTSASRLTSGFQGADRGRRGGSRAERRGDPRPPGQDRFLRR